MIANPTIISIIMYMLQAIYFTFQSLIKFAKLSGHENCLDKIHLIYFKSIIIPYVLKIEMYCAISVVARNMAVSCLYKDARRESQYLLPSATSIYL